MLKLREGLYKMPSENAATKYLASGIKVKVAKYIARASYTSEKTAHACTADDESSREGSDSDSDTATVTRGKLVVEKDKFTPVVTRRNTRFTYTVRHPRTHEIVEVCDFAFRSLYRVSGTKMTSARNLACAGPNAEIAPKIQVDRKRTKYIQARVVRFGGSSSSASANGQTTTPGCSLSTSLFSRSTPNTSSLGLTMCIRAIRKDQASAFSC